MKILASFLVPAVTLLCSVSLLHSLSADWTAGAGVQDRLLFSDTALMDSIGPKAFAGLTLDRFWEFQLGLDCGAWTGYSVGIDLSALVAPDWWGSYRPAAGLSATLLFGEALYHAVQFDPAGYPVTPRFAAGIKIIPIRFDLGNFRFSALELTGLFDLTSPGRFWQAQVGLFTMENKLDCNPPVSSNSNYPFFRMVFSAGIPVLVSMITGLDFGWLIPDLSLRFWDMLEVRLSGSFSSFVGIQKCYTSIDSGFSPRYGNYFPYIGIGYFLYTFDNSRLTLFLHSPLVVFAPLRFTLDGWLDFKDGHSLTVSFLEMSYAPILPLNNFADWYNGNLFIKIDVCKLGILL